MRVLITGATSGIGEALAKKLAKKGFSLMLTGRNEEELIQQKNTFSSKVEILVWDLSKGEKPIVEWIEEKKPQLIFNNAGFGKHALFHELTDQVVNEMIEVNMHTLTMITKKAIDLFLREKIKGTVVNISSAAAFFPFPNSSLYGATKAFVTALSRSLDAEYRKKGIRILASCPGLVDTNFSKRANASILKKKRKSRGVMSKEKVADLILQQLDKKKGVKVMDWQYNLLARLRHIIPRRLQEWVVEKSINI